MTFQSFLSLCGIRHASGEVRGIVLAGLSIFLLYHTRCNTIISQKPKTIVPQLLCAFVGGFDSRLAHHVGANVVSFAPTFFIKSQSAPILLLLLSKSQPLRWAAIWCRRFAAFFDCGKRSGLNGACRKRWSQTGSQFSFQRERRPFAGAPVAGRPVRGDGHRQRPFGRKSRK